MTAIHYAARQGHADVVKVLVKAGAAVNPREANDITPLLMAISNNNMAAAQFLLAQGGDVNAQDWYGRSPLWEAVNVRNLYVHNATFKNGIDRAPVLELIKELLAAGAQVNARTKETPPFRNHLLEITGSLEWVDFTGQTPFLTAALAGDVTAMKLLLAAWCRSEDRYLSGHLGPDGRGRRQLGGGADLDRRSRAAARGREALP